MRLRSLRVQYTPGMMRAGTAAMYCSHNALYLLKVLQRYSEGLALP
jgi:hypothetical protein